MLKNRFGQLCIALGCALIVMIIPRPEGTKFEIIGDQGDILISHVKDNFQLDFSFGTGLNYTMNYLSAGFSWNIASVKN